MIKSLYFGDRYLDEIKMKKITEGVGNLLFKYISSIEFQKNGVNSIISSELKNILGTPKCICCKKLMEEEKFLSLMVCSNKNCPGLGLTNYNLLYISSYFHNETKKLNI